MDGELERLGREIRSARQAIRRAGRTISQLQDQHGRELGRYQLQAGERLDQAEILDFLALALSGASEGVVIVVSQPTPGPDNQGEPDG